MAALNRWIIMWTVWLSVWLSACWAQDLSIVLPQGDIRGVRRPSNKKATVVAFLGIPYALPPVGDRRFRLPEMVQNSTRVVNAVQFGPACPQPDMDRLKVSEDCLLLNVWIPEMPVEFKTYPVIVFMEGEMFTTGNPGKYPAEDLAAEGLVVVSIQYRLNVFGFLSLATAEAPGNLGLWDQNMALKWVHANIDKFGGNTKLITLMGHGSGAASVSMHMVAPSSRGLFERAIVMSGSLFAPWAIARYPRDAASGVGHYLGCRARSTDDQLLTCLRSRDVGDILQAFSRHQQDLNTTELFGPVVDVEFAGDRPFFTRDPQEAMLKGDFQKVRVITGVAESEGYGMLNVIRNLGRKTFEDLVHFVLTASIPRTVDFYGFTTAWPTVYRTIRYHYFDKVPNKDKSGMIQQMLQFYSDAYYKAPHDHFVSNGLVRNNVPTFIYRYAYTTSDPFNNVLNTTGAPHGSELLYLFGPTVYRQEFGVGFSRQDEAVSDLIKRTWFEFANGGDPTPSPFGLKWEPSNKEEIKNYEIREQLIRVPYPKHKVAFWNEYLPSLEYLARGEEDSPVYKPPFDSRFRTDPTQPYQSIMWVLIAAISVLLVTFILSMASMRRRRPLV